MKRHGNYIQIEKGLTAVEGMDGNMPTLTIRNNGKISKQFRGSSLKFSTPLTDEDCDYIMSLATTGESGD